MEEEEYIKLYYPLTKKQKKDTMDIWKEYVEEDIYIRKNEIEKYCTINECDFLIALLNISNIIHEKYLCSTYGYENKKEFSFLESDKIRAFLEDRVISFINYGKPLNDEQYQFVDNTEYILNHKLYYYFHYHDSIDNTDYVKQLRLNYIDYEVVREDEKELDKQINILMEERQKNPEKYLNDIKNLPINEDEIYKSEFNIDPLLYPLSKKKTNNKESSESFISKFTLKQLEDIFKKSIDKKLFRSNTKLEDFLYVFNGEEKPNRFTKLYWIKESRNKSPNKKALIYYCMLMFKLKPEDIIHSFFNFINDRIITNDVVISSTNKPNIRYVDEEIRNIFPK
jgi:hypothetical protein